MSLNKLSEKSLPSRAGDRGSAVAEFALLAVPLCLVLVMACNYCLNVYFDSVLRFEAIASARFAALADVGLEEANGRAASHCLTEASWLATKCSIEIDAVGQFAVAHISYQPLSLALFQQERVSINASAALELQR